MCGIVPQRLSASDIKGRGGLCRHQEECGGMISVAEVKPIIFTPPCVRKHKFRHLAIDQPVMLCVYQVVKLTWQWAQDDE